MRFEPFAMMLHRRHTAGETISQLAAVFEIPEDRVEQRIRAATLFAQRQEAAQNIARPQDPIGNSGRR